MSYRETFTPKRLWIILGVSAAVSFGVLLFFGGRIYQEAPPLPAAVVTPDGNVVHTRENIEAGIDAWRALGGMQNGSVWGHGSYLAPDWTADWLHREAVFMLNEASNRTYQQPFQNLSYDRQARIQAIVVNDLHANQYNPNRDVIVVSPQRADAIAEITKHYQGLFGGDPAFNSLREQYAVPNKPALSQQQTHDLSAFFFWTSWSAVTRRPNDTVSYTSNWPSEPLVDNSPPASVFIWTLISILLLLAGVGALCWYYVRQHDAWHTDMIPEEGPPKNDPFLVASITPAARATTKYFLVVAALFFVQIILGAITAHYAVEGHDFYGIPLAEILPYAVTRTWHTQLAVFWIATAWLATGLYMAPLLADGRDPPYQKLGVNILFGALLIVVIGALAGQWAGVLQSLHPTTNFWFGHQGYEYVDLGRFWQILLFIGLLLWLTLMLRALLPALRAQQTPHLLWLVLVSSIAIGLLYGAGLFWGQHTHLSIVEYWRWWVVHLWVEGVFEVFATAIVSLLFVRMGLLRSSTATIAVMFATVVFLAGGVLGTFHHLYWSGTPVGVLAVGSVFSALEVVPLALVGFEAYNHYKAERSVSWTARYHWPLMFFLAVAFWNLVGAGLLGFFINPPMALYYMQGLLSTPSHGHAALFGVYGMLGIGLMLFCLRGLGPLQHQWSDRLLKWSFWSLNYGLAAMVFLSLFPQGVLQAVKSFNDGYHSARAPEFIHSPIMEFFVWLRVPGDIAFTIGAAALLLFLWRLFVPSRGARGAGVSQSDEGNKHATSSNPS